MATADAEFGACRIPEPINEPVRGYAPGSLERRTIELALSAMATSEIDMPLVIGGKSVARSARLPVSMPHSHRHLLGWAHQASAEDVQDAIASALAAAPEWSRTSARERASIFLKAAELLAGPWRDRLNAATMLGQSKTVHQAEIDSAAEFVDFLRFNVLFMERIYGEQPLSPAGVWNRTDYRPLEGFVFAVTPFNFTAIAGNLPCAPALMGNVVLWKPSHAAARSAHEIMALLTEAGLPPGVINLVHGDPAMVADVALGHQELAGVHFTGSTAVFDGILRKVGTGRYRSYPKVVGETGGKNFMLAHPSADFDAFAVAVIRGAFEYQGQKCSAASRVFVPRSRWPALRRRLTDEVASIKVGDVRDFSNFMGAVIDRRAFDRISGAIAEGKRSPSARLLAGGESDDAEGFFIRPTLFECDTLDVPLMTNELFGPVAAVHVYDDADYDGMIARIDSGSSYGLTGAIFARERSAILRGLDGLRHAAGNLYVNDKPTGAVVGQQPFGGARASGTNDKAGSVWNLMRWVSPRTVKETFCPPKDYRYPFMESL